MTGIKASPGAKLWLGNQSGGRPSTTRYTLLSNCPTCAETRVQCSEPMMPSTTPTRPWQEVGVDLFHLNDQDYVLLVDYGSRFPEVISLRSTTAPAVINVIKSVFACHGIPRLVRSDNGPQFAREFSAFAESYGFRHVTSSPHFPQSNGEVERMVRTVKDLLRKADDPYLALLAYRDSPGVNRVSPAQLLMGWRLETRVPKTSHQLEPAWPPSVPFTRRDQDNRRRQASTFNRRHAARSSRPLQVGEQVWVRDVNRPAIISSTAPLLRGGDSDGCTPAQPNAPGTNDGMSCGMHYQRTWNSRGRRRPPCPQQRLELIEQPKTREPHCLGKAPPL
ncbi:uncharacterized protein K02A2.6-like [Dermacentor silvarum]|uniref:uncharacterized protein K02A2.6-like n=1 Tax=Dermacentor silvarum TaxID=543639 RepID=UPI0018998CB5|nr:uncharacterized protein K02A2.6-like [Dermacentor silvarum]